jgi:hypothetical protein
MEFNKPWHLVRDQEAGGSNLLAPTIFLASFFQSTQKPRPFQKSGSVGHPERPYQSLGVEVLEWNPAIVIVRQQQNVKGCATRRNMTEGWPPVHWRVGPHYALLYKPPDSAAYSPFFPKLDFHSRRL